MNYKKEAKKWEKHYESLPLKKGLYTPLFKRGATETDEEYVKHCEDAATLMCCMGLYSTGDEKIQKKVADYMESRESIAEEFAKLVKLEIEHEQQNYTSMDLDGFQKIQLPLGTKNEHSKSI